MYTKLREFFLFVGVPVAIYAFWSMIAVDMSKKTEPVIKPAPVIKETAEFWTAKSRTGKNYPIYLWKDFQAVDRAAEISRAGGSRYDFSAFDEYEPYLACGVQNKTRLQLLVSNDNSSAFRVIDGPNEGCIGVAENDEVVPEK